MHFIDHIPLPLLFFALFALVLVATDAGYRVQKLLLSRGRGGDKEGPAGAVVQSILALLAFLLAFTFGLAAERFGERRQLVIDEASAIRTTFLQADFLPEPAKAEVKSLLKSYVELRLQYVRDPDAESKCEDYKAKILLQQRGLWQTAVKLGKSNFDSDVAALFIESLNELINVHARRVTAGLYARVPLPVWIVLVVLVVLGMSALGYQSGLVESRNSPVVISLAVSLSLVMMMIADLDSPTQGFLMTGQKPLVDLAEEMHIILHSD